MRHPPRCPSANRRSHLPLRVLRREIRVTVHPDPKAEVLATLRDDIGDAIIDLSNLEPEPAEDSQDAPSSAEVTPPDVTDARETTPGRTTDHRGLLHARLTSGRPPSAQPANAAGGPRRCLP